MRRIPVYLLLGALMAAPVPATADEARLGGDIFLGGSGPAGAVAGGRDVFAAGPAVTLEGSVAQDTHAAGFDVEVDADTGGNVYAAGVAVTIRATVGEDLTAAGMSLRTAASAVTQGNARLAGGSLTIGGPVGGALAAAGGEIILNAPIGGDVWLVGESISFGPDAQVAGTLTYSSPHEVTVPESVAPAARVVFRPMERGAFFEEMRESWGAAEYPVLPTFMTLFAGFLVTLAFLVVIGAVCLAFLPERVERLRAEALARPGLSLLAGVLGLSALVGLIPVSAATIIGIPLVPFAVLALILAWTLGYILGAYALALRMWAALGGAAEPGLAGRLAALAAGIAVFALLNFIPFFGWLANFALVLLGLGAMTRGAMVRLAGAGGAEAATIEKGET